ncbi:MAG TPA: thymidine phosphorylase family protein [Gammaproteobacteria bacterium]|nr:thymidine phosphorylase family protein [Gammaproteobacteria bacterium]
MTPPGPELTLNDGHGRQTSTLRLRRIGIDTYQEAVIYMRRDCHICRAEGFEAQSRVQIAHGDHFIIATLNVVDGDLLLPGEAGLSEAAWRLLGAREGDVAALAHPRPLESLSRVRAKVYGQRLEAADMQAIIRDVTAGYYADIQLAAFVAACAGDRLDLDETIALTRAMIDVGERIEWGARPIVDKHSVGGLPGNRTTPIVVAIVAAYGLIMPKTSSRAITSPAGTADVMETMTEVNLDVAAMRRVVEREGACLVWGGAVRLSPADDILIRVERPLDLDSEGQLVASVLSKKAAAGSTHVVIDIPVGPTAKVRSEEAAQTLATRLVAVGRTLDLTVRTVVSDGTQPVGRGIGPALEARDVLAVLRREPNAPQDLRERALLLAGRVLELSATVAPGEGRRHAQSILDDGRALKKFEAICVAQGGLRTPPRAVHTMPIAAYQAGRVASIDNRRLARIAKLAGAPRAPAAGVELHTPLGTSVEAGQPLFTLHAETPGEISYALDYVQAQLPIVRVAPA